MSYPDLLFMWSDRVVQPVASLNKAWARANREVTRFVQQNRCLVVRDHELELDAWRYLRGDGVHLNPVGVDMWYLGLQNGVQRALCVWQTAQT